MGCLQLLYRGKYNINLNITIPCLAAEAGAFNMSNQDTVVNMTAVPEPETPHSVILGRLVGEFTHHKKRLERTIKKYAVIGFLVELTGVISAMLGIVLNLLSFILEAPSLRILDFSNDMLMLTVVVVLTVTKINIKIPIYQSQVRDIRSAIDSILRRKIMLHDNRINTDHALVYIERMQEKLNAMLHTETLV